MTRRLMSTILAASLALTSFTATPVRAADSGEIGRLLLGAGALFIIGSALSNNTSSGNSSREVTRHNYPPVTRNRYVEPYKVKPRYKVVPSSCLRESYSNHGKVRYFGSRCLQQNMRHSAGLPGACLMSVRTDRGWRQGYDPRCLRQYGYTRG